MKKMTAAWKRARGALFVLAALVTTAAASGTALAQQFEKIENIPRQEIPAGRFVSIAYGIIWLAILGYVLIIAGGVKRVSQQLDDLRRRLNRGPKE